jgi:hypothetical protein
MKAGSRRVLGELDVVMGHLTTFLRREVSHHDKRSHEDAARGGR